jgi:hypothetical protein
MTKKTKILYFFTLIIVFFVVVITFYKIFILHDYLISYEVSCDPKIESCFVVVCDEETGEGCDIDDSEKYYKLVEKKAFNAVKCSSDDSNCLSCQEGETDCIAIFCDPSTEEAGCSNL